MKFFSSLSLLFLAGVANAQYKCYCTGFGAADPDQFSNTCCVTGDGVTFPDGVDRKGTWLNDGGLCQFSGLGQFSQNQFISAYAACCASTGPQEGDKYGGNCF